MIQRTHLPEELKGIIKKIEKNMKPKLQDLIKLLDKIAPFSMAEEWDNSGLQVGNPLQGIEKILIALDPTMKALLKASEVDAQLLLTHHPLIFKPLSLINQEEYPGNVLFQSIEKCISILAAHTNLDAAEMGINHMLADLFGLLNTEVLYEKVLSDRVRTGLGRIGNLSESKNLLALTEDVERCLDNPNIKVLGQEDKVIKRVAVVGGSGGDFISISHQMGADILITGDVNHHQALKAQTLGMALMDAGHFHTEKAAMRRFAAFLKQKLDKNDWNVDVEFYENEDDPMGLLNKEKG